MLDLLRLTQRDLALLDRLCQHEPLSTSEIRLLFFTGARTCRARLAKLHAEDLLTRVYLARSQQGGSVEGLWFLSPRGRRAIDAPSRRPPGLSIPDLEHRREVARFFVGLVQRSLALPGDGLYSWLGEQQAQQGTGATVRPDGFGRYLLPDREITFYLELDRGTEPTRRVKAKLDAYAQALAADPDRDRGNVLLVCGSRRDSRALRAARRQGHRGCGAPPTASDSCCYPTATKSGPSQSCRPGHATHAATSATASANAGAPATRRR
ncbi:MAG: replication-relaxation family protein [Solirubrobacteraceae bacterium]